MPEKSNPATGARGAPVDISADGIAEQKPPPLNSQRAAHPALIRIIARRVPWPSLQERPDRAGLRLRWDALHEETGELLVAATEYPLPDAAYVLAIRGADPETLVNMRHEGAPHDSFVPMPLCVAATVGAKRAETKARMAALGYRGCEETSEEGAEGRVVPAEAQAAALGGRARTPGAQAALARALDTDTGSAASGCSGGRP